MQRLVEGVVMKVLRQYVKDIQRENLTIAVWSGDIFLKDVELVLDAFDYLQLPFALKEGRVGKLSIRVPWRKFGWEPIIITLEDVFIRASKRDDQEWSLEAVERREFAAKKAKLVAAELGKLSRRVCDSQAGQSFLSYITTKVLDNIQLSIKNFHVLYTDMQNDSVNVMLGIRLSSLTIMKQDPVGLSSGRGVQVNKVVEVTGLEIYCSTSQEVVDLVSADNFQNSTFCGNARVGCNKHDHILAPCDVSLLVNKLGQLDDDSPQYSISAAITGLVMSLNEVQLQRILILWDYLSTYEMREKYGRYRPWHCPLSKKSHGWPKLWWNYAQESILSDIRKKLKKTSWRYFGHRLIYRRKYVNLYKTKLLSLREEQLVEKSVLHELEQMEKESDIDDILNFRSAAECELQDFLLDSPVSNNGMNGGNTVIDTSPNEEHSSRKSRGWLNWLSRGMLGAGGTDDSSQFSGVVSDEVIKDIYEATSFHPLASPNSNEDAAANETICTCALKFSIHQVSATLRSMSSNQDIAEVLVNGAIFDCNLWDGFVSSTVLINSIEMICPRNKKAILRIRKSSTDNNVLENEQSSCRVQVVTSPDQEIQLSINVVLQPLEVTCHTDFFLNLFEIFDVLKSSTFQRERVLASLNGIEDVKTRLLSKAEYILSSHKKVMWDVSIVNVVISFPWINSVSEQCNMILESKRLCIKSETNPCSSTSSTEDQSYILKQLSNLVSSCDYLRTFRIRDLYDLFKVIFEDFEIKVLMPRCPEAITILERCSASINLASCVIPNESILKQLEVYLVASSLAVNLSPIICESVLELIANLRVLHSRSVSLMMRNHNSRHITSYKLGAPIFYFSLTADLEIVSCYINLANAGDDSSTIMISLPKLDIRYGLMEYEEYWVSVRALKITTYPFKGEGDVHTLCSSGKLCGISSVYQQDMVIGRTNLLDNCNGGSPSAEACFLFHHEASRRRDVVWQRCRIWLNDIDLHCHPYIIGLLMGFHDRISAFGACLNANFFSHSEDEKPPKAMPDFPSQKVFHSSFLETMSSENENISLDCFPFVTISNSDAFVNLEGSLPYPITDWRKYFRVRDIQSENPRNIIKNGYKSTPLESTGMLILPSSGAANLFPIDMNFTDVRVHMHDSSCIVGSLTLSASKSLLSFSDDFMDIMCSLDGLILSSSWSPHEPNNFVWGPISSDLSPVLNIRVRKGDVSLLHSELEVSIGIQHVCCTLSPEYLAIIIGYFSLPDWNSSFQQPITENYEYAETGQESSIVYKIEILDSIVLLPPESKVQQRLKLDIQRLYCSFIHNGTSDIIFDGIPSEYVIPSPEVARRYNCLNIFGRDLLLSFVLLEDNAYVYSDHNTGHGPISLIAPLSADIWIRFPCEDEISFGGSPASTCIMARIINCQLFTDDCQRFDGFKALLDVINHFSSVTDEARCFTSDVLQFLQTKTDPNKISVVSPVSSGVVITEIRCSVDSLSAKLHCLKDESTLPVAKITTQFSFLASFRDSKPLSLDWSFSSLALHSLLSCVSLAQCAVTCSTSTVLSISLLKSNGDADEVQISLPSLHIWLHFVDWTNVIDLVNSYSGKLAKTAHVNESPKSCGTVYIDPKEDTMQTSSQSLLQSAGISTDVAPEKINDNFNLIVRSEDVGITFHLPIQVNEEAFNVFRIVEVEEDKSQSVISNIKEGKWCKFVAVTTHSRSSELHITDKNVRLKLTLDKISSAVEICSEKTVNSWPFFQILQVSVEAVILSNLPELLHANVEVQCDLFEVWLSHRVFYFWNNIGLDIPEVGSSRPMFSDVDFKLKLRKVSLLLTDGRWSCSGPLLEFLMRDALMCANVKESGMDVSLASDLQVNYNNIDKVVWEPFVEPWKFDLKMIRKFKTIGLLKSSIATDINLSSMAQLNLNFTESFIECAFRTTKMVMDAWGLITPNDIPETKSFLSHQFTEDVCAGRYAPYIIQNLTSLPLVYHVYLGQVNSDEFDVKEMDSGKSVDPGSSVPIYLNETQEEQLSRYRPAQHSDRLNENQLNKVAHHFMAVQLDGTSMPSAPISMDLVGLTSFEVDFSKVSNKTEVEKTGDAINHKAKNKENVRTNVHSGFVVPVVFDVSVQRNSKFIRLYSTVILFNATSVPLEIRFDIPFGLSPMILDPIYPGQEFPLPLHLAEAGRMRWRPLGDSYLWSEAHNLSNILSQETKIGFLRSFVCYPSHPSSNPFRCCISVQNICLPSSTREEKVSSPHFNRTLNPPVESCDKMLHGQGKSRKRFIHHVTLSTPLVVNNYLPEAVSLMIDSGGVTHTSLLSEMQTSFHHTDPSHDLGLEFHMHGFRPSTLKFPRTEIFSTIGKCSGSKFSLSETVTFNSAVQNGPVYVTMEKMMDAYSGAREVFVFVPFLLCNCTGFPLIINAANETKETGCTLPSCYDLTDHELLDEKDGLSLLSSDKVSYPRSPNSISAEISLSKSHIISTRKNVDNPYPSRFPNRPLISSRSFNTFPGQLYRHNSESQKGCLRSLREPDFAENDRQRVKACMYSPNPASSSSEVTVKVCMSPSECGTDYVPNSVWSNPFSLLPPSGSSNVLVPQLSSNAAFIISVTSSALGGAFAGRTEAITFQPRYVISNACSKDLCYKQKGTELVFNLGIGQHSHLHWTDTTRDLLVSIRFHEPGWQWSGCFLPDYLGDTQVKMRNYVSGALNMVRVEVQNADISMGDEKIVGSLHGNSGTNLILLSDDDTGYMPYRIDNFSKERLRIYQQRCETFDTIVHPYTSCPYAWDEPCYPHRLSIEVPGERILGSYTLDEVKEYAPVCVQSTSERPERILLLSVHAEGATKVLSIIDSSYHILKDTKDSSVPRLSEKGKHELKQDKQMDYKEKFSLNIPYVGISVINSYPQELLFVCARNITIDLLQSLDQQKLTFQILSLQIDNQLRSAPFPVVLSFDRDCRLNPTNQIKTKDNAGRTVVQTTSNCSGEPVFYVSVALWRNKDVSLVSFEYICLRVEDCHLELEQGLILSLFDFLKAVSSRFQSRVLPILDSTTNDAGLNESSARVQAHGYLKDGDQQLNSMNAASSKNHKNSPLLFSVVPIGAPWQQIYLLARRQKKIYVELFDLAPINLTLSFSSSPWMLRNGVLASGESVIHRGLMALADVEGARIHLKQLTITHQMASWESIREILIRHYTRQLLHETYKVFGSAGVIGNPMGFARSLGLGIRDFLSAPARSILQSPTGLITGVAEGTTSLVSNTVYALSDAATQFTKAAHKGIVAFTFDDQAVARMENQQTGVASHSKGLVNEVLEGLTGLLQSPIKGAEKHGLPGVLSGIAMGITGVVARPAASILEATGKTAQSIRNRSRRYQTGAQRYRTRLPRPLSRELPLRPYSWEEAVGASVLVEAHDGVKFEDQVLVMCKALKQPGKYVIITERLILIISCPSLANLGNPDFRGVPIDPEWMIESEIGLESVIHTDCDEGVVHIVGSSSDAILRQNQHQSKKGGAGTRTKRWSNIPTPLPLFQTNLELDREEDGECLLEILLSTIEKGKQRGRGSAHLLHQSNIK